MNLKKYILKSKRAVKKTVGKEDSKAIVINIMGLSRCVGVTHLAIMLATYFSSGRHCRVAVIEYGQQGCYETIKREEKIKKVRLSVTAASRHAFSSHGIDFYESVHNIGIIGMLAEIYDYIVVDMRAEDASYNSVQLLGDWLNANQSIAVTSLVPWKARECRARLNRINGTGVGHKVKLVSLTANSFSESKIKIIPWEPDPFCIRTDNLPWLKNMVED